MPRSSRFLTPISFDHRNAKHNWWLFQCLCGNTTVKRNDQIKPDSSCGCYDSRKNTADSFFARAENNNGCLEWVSPFNSAGYGVVRFEQKLWQTHRLAYTLTYGDIPEGLLVCHKCDNRKCINPDHLFLGTYKDNYEDSRTKNRNTKGLIHGNRKLVPLDVVSIKELKGQGANNRFLAAKFGVNICTIQRVIKGEAWGHI